MILRNKLTLLLIIILNLGIKSQTTYYWNGSVNSSFSTAGNWTPFRQVGHVTDILIFENSGNVNVTNVNQVTIGQLIVRNNTNLTLSPAAGNPRVITVRGGKGTDLLIEPGSGLRILANDPPLNIYLGADATAEIFGTLKFEGNIACYINSAESNAIRFKSGSKLYQNSPGYVFGSAGVNNSVIFEAGSECIINHSLALSPFGLHAPNSKVSFESSSKLKINAISSLQFNGRTLADLEIGSGLNLNISESFNSDLTIENIKVLSGAVLNFRNLNSAYIPTIYFKSDIDVNGVLKFTDDLNNKFNIIFTGSTLQKICGNGDIIIPENLNKFELRNNILLERNLAVNCPVYINRYEIIRNGFEFYFNPAFGNPFERNKTLTSPVIGKPEGEGNYISSMNISDIPMRFDISQNYPNPFNPKCKIDFALPFDAKVTIKVYDILGREVATLLDAFKTADYYTVEFDGTNVASGTYFYRITADNNGQTMTKTLKMILVK